MLVPFAGVDTLFFLSSFFCVFLDNCRVLAANGHRRSVRHVAAHAGHLSRVRAQSSLQPASTGRVQTEGKVCSRFAAFGRQKPAARPLTGDVFNISNASGQNILGTKVQNSRTNRRVALSRTFATLSTPVLCSVFLFAPLPFVHWLALCRFHVISSRSTNYWRIHLTITSSDAV